MPVRPIFDSANLYFITTTAVQRVHLFQRDVIKHIIVDSLNYMRVNNWLKLYAFVVMPNHIHLVVRCLELHTLESMMREFKKYTSKQIIRQYQAENNRQVLTFLEQSAQHLSNQRHKVWGKGYDARDIFTPDFLRQKVAYIHNNPCQARWQLVESPELYPWSSARYYLLGEPTIIPIDDLGEMLA